MSTDLTSVRAQVEKWHPVVDWEQLYEVSDQGRVRSIRSGIVLRPWGKRYPTVSLWRNGHRTARCVHHIVLDAFVGPRPHGLEVLHANDVKIDNRLSNLSYGTRSENLHDAVRNGTHGMAKRVLCKCGEPLTSNGIQRRCATCQRRGQREWAQRNRAARKVSA